MPEALAPVDTAVNVPEVVKRAAAAAEAAHAAAYTPPNPDPTPQPEPQAAPAAADPPVAEPTAAPVAQPEPQPPVQPPAQSIDWESRYNSMRGRFDQSQRTLGGMQEQLSELGNELVRTQTLLRGPNAQPQPQSMALLTPEDKQNYGSDLIEVVQRAALDVVQPRLSHVEQENQQLRQRLALEAQNRVFQTLDVDIPNWREINDSDRFKQWCRLPDLYSGVLRGRLMNDAFRAGNTARVIAFFRGFLSEEVVTGQTPAPQPLAPQPVRTAAVPLESLAAPGRANPATGGNTVVAADKPIITRAQISQFYSQEGRAKYAGREADRKADEAMIFLAQREGRVR